MEDVEKQELEEPVGESRGVDDLLDGLDLDIEDEPIRDDDILDAIHNPSERVKAELQKMVADAVKKALAKHTPKRSTVKADPITKEQFNDMTYEQRENLFNTNRNLYEKLKNF